MGSYSEWAHACRSVLCEHAQWQALCWHDVKTANLMVAMDRQLEPVSALPPLCHDWDVFLHLCNTIQVRGVGLHRCSLWPWPSCAVLSPAGGADDAATGGGSEGTCHEAQTLEAGGRGRRALVDRLVPSCSIQLNSQVFTRESLSNKDLPINCCFSLSSSLIQECGGMKQD